MFSQHSRRHSNDTNSDLSDDEIFLPDETKVGSIRRTSKTGEILASPTHRKLTPTHIRSTGSSPIKRIKKYSQSETRSLDGDKIDSQTADSIHEHYRKVIAEMKQTHEDNVKHLQYKLQSLEGSPADDEYLVRKNKIMKSTSDSFYSRIMAFLNNFVNLWLISYILCSFAISHDTE